KQTQTFYFSWTPVEQKEKDWIVKQKIEGVKMEIQIGGNTISYDSSNPGTANNPLSEFFKALKDSEFTLTIGPDMKVTKVEGREGGAQGQPAGPGGSGRRSAFPHQGRQARQQECDRHDLLRYQAGPGRQLRDEPDPGRHARHRDRRHDYQGRAETDAEDDRQ